MAEPNIIQSNSTGYRNERIARLGNRRMSREDQIIEQRWREQLNDLQTKMENLRESIASVDSEKQKSDLRKRLDDMKKQYAAELSLYNRRF